MASQGLETGFRSTGDEIAICVHKAETYGGNNREQGGLEENYFWPVTD